MKIDHIAINVKDIEKSVKWYMDNIGGRILYQDDTWAFIKFENIKMAFVKKGTHPAHFAFEVENFEGIEGKVGTHRDGSKSVYKKDPWGNIYELINYEYKK